MKTTQDFIDDVDSSVTNFLRGMIANVRALAMVDIKTKSELKALEKKLKYALDIVDGTLHDEFSERTKEMWKSGQLTPKESKLAQHHERIIIALGEGVPKAKIARELGVNRKTIFRYIKKHIQP